MKKSFVVLLAAVLLLSVMAVTVSAKTEYAGMTDEDLYREIDEDLFVRSYNSYAWERVLGRLLITTESSVTAEELSAALAGIGLSGELDDSEAYPEVSVLSGGGFVVTAAVSEETIRETMFALHRLEQIVAAVDPVLLVSACAGPGDVNLDGFYNAKDYMMLKRIALETFTPSRMQAAAADVNGDGAVNAKDYLMLKRIVLGTYDA